MTNAGERRMLFEIASSLVTVSDVGAGRLDPMAAKERQKRILDGARQRFGHLRDVLNALQGLVGTDARAMMNASLAAFDDKGPRLVNLAARQPLGGSGQGVPSGEGPERTAARAVLTALAEPLLMQDRVDDWNKVRIALTEAQPETEVPKE